ncbi:hypothetical protein FHG87_017559 [Trinorchestia longiramus]|nr:hypothetical protein FHG87_017559 [Trinorchestia longiramus]
MEENIKSRVFECLSVTCTPLRTERQEGEIHALISRTLWQENRPRDPKKLQKANIFLQYTLPNMTFSKRDSNPGLSACKQIRSPVDQAGDPVDQAGEPVDQAGEPVDQAGEPVDQAGEPVDQTGEVDQADNMMTRGQMLVGLAKAKHLNEHLNSSNAGDAGDGQRVNQPCQQDSRVKLVDYASSTSSCSSNQVSFNDTLAYSAKPCSEILPKVSTRRLFDENGTSDAANLTIEEHDEIRGVTISAKLRKHMYKYRSIRKNYLLPTLSAIF